MSYLADHDAPVTMLSVKEKFFPQLSDKEALYAHFMSKASHAGTRVVLRQVSSESEPIFDLVMTIHQKLGGSYDGIELAPNEIQFYLEYVSQFLTNLGNFKSFGDVKFIPRCRIESFKSIVQAASIDLGQHLRTVCGNQYSHVSLPYTSVNDLIEQGIYYVDDKVSLLGYTADGYTSSYYMGQGISLEDMKLLKEELFGKYNILPENTRIYKRANDEFYIFVASGAVENELEQYPKGVITLSNGTKVSFKFGDHTREMQLISKYLAEAKKYAANEYQIKMLDEYIRHFETGSSHAHKEAQKYWVKDISPVVETNIGFIETYREPSGIIGEYESLVAIQNKERTKKFGAMVSRAEEFISELPWSADFEKPKFNPPDFTSLEVLTFTGSGIPAGINIPNYDDVRLNIGFKNVSLGNILSASAKASAKHPPTFIKSEDRGIFEKYQSDSFEVQVGIHELLGHGSGKLLCQIEDGFNFDIENPPTGLDGKPVSTYYKLGETWGSKFGQLAGAFEECRAEVIAMYLITNRELLSIFGFTEKTDQDSIIYAGYLQMARAGLMALEFWDPKTRKWGQPHMQARFSIMKTFLKHSSDPNFLRINFDETKPNDLHIDLNPDLIESVGHACVKDYLHHLHIYKCSGDVEQGSAYFIDRSTVTEDLAKMRDTVISKRLPRRQFIQANSEIVDGKVLLHEYEETAIGMIQSFAERVF